MKLGTLLLRNAEISLTQLEAALRTQVLYGGRLGTNLVELGFIDVELLTLYLAESLGLPMASQELFEEVSQEVVDDFGPDLARRFEAFPLAGATRGTLPVAMVDPSAEHRVAELASEVGMTIAPHVAPELRIYYYLEAHYGITRRARYVRMGTRGNGARAQDERRRTQPAGGIVVTPRVILSPRARDEVDAGQAASASRPTGGSGPTGRTLTMSQACAAIDGAEQRDDIGDVLAEFGRGRFGATAIFVLRDNNALGWRLQHETPQRALSIEEVSLPLGAASVLQAAHDSARPYRGGPLSPGMPTERQLWRALGVTAPREDMAVLPVLAKSRVVNLVYVHGRGGRALDDGCLDELTTLVEHASAAYERLLRSARDVAGTP